MGNFFSIKFIALALMCLALFPAERASAATLGTPNTSALTNGLVGYWPLDGATTNWKTGITSDVSGQGNNGSLVAMSTTSSPDIGKVDGSFKFVRNFSASTGYVSVPDSSSLQNSAASSFTISLWIRLPVNYSDGNNSNVIEKAVDSANPGWGMYLNGSNSDFKIRLARVGGFVDVVAGKSYAIFATSTWSQAAVIIDKNTNLATWYINGVQTGTPANISAVTSMVNTQALHFGAGAAGFGVDTMGGNLDDIRIYNRALSAQEIALLYASGKANIAHSNTVSLSSGLVAYWPLDGATTNWKTGTTNDLSGNGYNLRLASMSTTSSPIAGRIGGALNFNGSSGYAFTNTAAVNLGSRFTAALWAKWNGGGAVNKHALDIRGTGVEVLAFQFGPGDIFFRTSGATVPVGGQPAISYSSDNKWHQYVAVADGTNVVLYKDGLKVNSAAWGGSLTAITGWTIGTDSSIGSFYGGGLDDIRIYNRALSAQEVGQLYVLGSANVAHSNTVSLTTGLVGYWTFDGGSMNWRTNTVADQSGSGNTGTLVSMSTTSSPTIGKIGQALKFNGLTTAINNFSTSISPAGSSRTVSAWIKPAGTARAGIVGTRDLNFVNTGWVFTTNRTTPGNLTYFQNGFILEAAAGLTVGTWTHVVATYNASTAVGTLYANGRQIGTLGGFTSELTSATNGALGNEYGNAVGALLTYNGSIDDLRIYNRVLSAQEVGQLYLMGK